MPGLISHAFSQSIADASGTITIFGTNGRTVTIEASNLVGANAWNSAHQQLMTLAGNTAGVSTLSGSNFILSGNNNVTLSGVQGANVATLGISAGADTIDQISISAGTASAALGSLVFSNGSNVSFGLNGSTITASVATSLTGVNLSAGTTSNNLTAAVFSNSNNATFGLNGSTVTVSAPLNVSAGTTSNNLTQLSFSNVNGVSFGLNAGTLTGSIAAAAGLQTISYWDNYAYGITNTMASQSWFNFVQSSSYIEPFVLPLPLSASFVRLPATIEIGQGNTKDTTANSSISRGFSQTFAVGIYSQATGASSLSLSLLASSTAAWIHSSAIHMNANGSQYSQTFAISYLAAGNTTSISTTFASTQTSWRFLSSILGSNLEGKRGLDIPFASSLQAGNYWLAIGGWTTTGTTGTNDIPNAGISASAIMFSNSNAGWQVVGDTATASSNWARLGQGSFSSTTSGMPNAIALAAISTSAGQPSFPFAMIRQA